MTLIIHEITLSLQKIGGASTIRDKLHCIQFALSLQKTDDMKEP